MSLVPAGRIILVNIAQKGWEMPFVKRGNADRLLFLDGIGWEAENEELCVKRNPGLHGAR